MKNKHFILAAFLLIAGTLLTGCDSNRENVKEKVLQANQDMADEQAQYEKEWQQFKIETELKIDANKKKIDDFNAAMKTTSKKFKAKYENVVLTLEQKNIELQKKLNNYKYEGKDNWEKFKQGFNDEMDSVGKALNDLFTKKD
ncbi:MAG: hypothetical protein CVV24_14200 [Ignavibacteriae bacterium HGW-Ignavibacteriae-3]|nr:MAG: hypothetical protein CVV24_14200 [Ignavibacteriae bacterium HGW-Ignavibacteriae-3]